MTFPVPGARIAARFDDRRPNSTGRHEGWDMAAAHGTPILSPWSGTAIYAHVRHGRDGRHRDWGLSWPDGRWWEFSNYAGVSYGGIVAVYGEDHTALFCHLDLSELYAQLAAMATFAPIETPDPPFLRKMRSDDWHVWSAGEANLSTPRRVQEGEVIGHIGIEGADTGPHVHMEIHPPGRRWQKLDPQILWPEL